jgi:hypothetical protein
MPGSTAFGGGSIRWEKKAANYLGFVQLAACLIVYRKLRHVQSLSG